MTTMRQWRLMINGEVVDDGPPEGGQTLRELEDEARRARTAEGARHQRLGGMTPSQRAAGRARQKRETWLIAGAGAAGELLLSVAALVLLPADVRVLVMLVPLACALAMLAMGALMNR